MLIAGLAGLLSVVGGITILFGLAPGILGGSGEPLWVAIGLGMLVLGPILLGLTRARWPRALVAGLTAPVGAYALAGTLSLGFSTLGVRLWEPISTRNPVLGVAFYVALLVGVTELVTERLASSRLIGILRGVAISLLIAIGLEIFRFTLMRIVAGPELVHEPEWLRWLAGTISAFVVSANVVYLEGPVGSPDTRISISPSRLFVGLNAVAILTTAVAVFFA